MARARTVTFTQSARDAIAAESDYYFRKDGQSVADRWEASVGTAVHSLLSMTERGTRFHSERRGLAEVRWIFVPGLRFDSSTRSSGRSTSFVWSIFCMNAGRLMIFCRLQWMSPWTPELLADDLDEDSVGEGGSA